MGNYEFVILIYFIFNFMYRLHDFAKTYCDYFIIYCNCDWTVILHFIKMFHIAAETSRHKRQNFHYVENGIFKGVHTVYKFIFYKLQYKYLCLNLCLKSLLSNVQTLKLLTCQIPKALILEEFLLLTWTLVHKKKSLSFDNHDLVRYILFQF